MPRPCAVAGRWGTCRAPPPARSECDQRDEAPRVAPASASFAQPPATAAWPAAHPARRAGARADPRHGGEDVVHVPCVTYGAGCGPARAHGWRSEDWDALVWTVRAPAVPTPCDARRSPPAVGMAATRGRTGRSAPLARALHKANATAMITEPQSERRLRSGIVDSGKNAARIAAARHLPDITLRRCVVIDRG